MKTETRPERLDRWLGFGLAFALLLGYLLLRNEQNKPYDAWTYSQLADGFTQNGLFNLSAYAACCGDSMRGYLFPWLLAASQSLSGILPLLDYRLVVSAFVALTTAVVLPDLVVLLFGGERINPLRRLVVPALLLVFWNGLLAYPLTDLWSAGFAILAVYGLVYGFKQEDAGLGRRAWAAALAGFATGAAYNIRTVYLFLLLGEAVLIPALFLTARKTPLLRRLAWLGCVLAGFVLVSLPQMAINQEAYGVPSFTLASKSGSNLYINMLYDGMYTTKYESYTGIDYGYEGMTYVDPAGEALMEQEGLEVTYTFGTGATEIKDLGTYLLLVARHPLDFIGIFGRHLFSMLDVRYPNIYVDTIESNGWIAFANYTLLYLALIAAWRMLRGRGKALGWLALAVLLLPVVAVLPGSMEPRYGVLLYMALWAAAASRIRWASLRRLTLRAAAGYALGYVLFVVVLCTCNGIISASLLENPVLYS